MTLKCKITTPELVRAYNKQRLRPYHWNGQREVEEELKGGKQKINGKGL